ncbi:hypothetical protein [Kribbia dieselivorans]|uniref:hypothetical protein n=1 Tax=Kribbia dieselivorans TaxID=331526 RepID=UPI000838F7B3|nr:hypothetical protein [Kribbia dieselivorans]
MRKTLAIGATTALLITPFALATPAQAAPTCSIKVNKEIWVDQPTEYLVITDGSEACKSSVAKWGVFDPKGKRRGTLTIDARYGTVSKVKIKDYYPSGTYKVRPDGAVNARTGAKVGQNTVSMVKKFGIKGPISYRRVGSSLRVTTTIKRYSSASHAFRAHSGATIKLYRRASTGQSWKLVTSGRTNSKGTLTLRASASRSYYYQVYVSPTSTVWGAKSTRSTRI